MTRTQLYLDDDLLKKLRSTARREKTTVSELVRRAVRQQDATPSKDRAAIFRSVVGLWADRTDLPPTEQYIRELRADRGRLARIYK